MRARPRRCYNRPSGDEERAPSGTTAAAHNRKDERGTRQRAGAHPRQRGSRPQPLPHGARGPAHRGQHRAGAVRAYEGAEHGGAHPAPSVLGVRARHGRRDARDTLPGRGLRHRPHDAHRARALRARLGSRAHRPRRASLAAARGRAPGAPRGRGRGRGPALHAVRAAGRRRRAHRRRAGRADRGRAHLPRALRGPARRVAALRHRRRQLRPRGLLHLARGRGARRGGRARANRTTTWPYAGRSPS